MVQLQYDKQVYQPRVSIPEATLQLFITNRCNKRCKGCFYGNKLGYGDMELSYYKDVVDSYVDQAKKITLIGGEPTLHPQLMDMVNHNKQLGLKTTIYTNGTLLHRFEGCDFSSVSLRVGVLGLTGTEKNLADVDCNSELMVVYMLRRDNVSQLADTVKFAEENFNCSGVMLSSIRDLIETQNFWTDTHDTLSNLEYATEAQRFISEYKGNLPSIHICRRAVIEGPTSHPTCRYLNVYPNGEKTICPLDISLGITDGEGYQLNTRKCTKHKECILQKVVIERKC